jgi:hypothetical protein
MSLRTVIKMTWEKKDLINDENKAEEEITKK